MWRLTIAIFVLFAGCTIPAQVFFRNFSNKEVRLQATLVSRRYFDKLPNKVNYYDTATKKRQYNGNWRSAAFVNWMDSTTFYLTVPAFTVVDVADISNGLVLGSRQPGVILSLITQGKADTLTTGDYLSLTEKFHSTGYGLFRSPVYYYDVR